jgi:hypothetical protein
MCHQAARGSCNKKNSPVNLYRYSNVLYCLKSIREAHAELDKLSHVLQKHVQFADFPVSEIWRIGIEVHHQSQNPSQAWAGFENESGYMAGIYRGLARVVQSDLNKERLSSDAIVQLHDTVTQGVSKGIDRQGRKIGRRKIDISKLTMPGFLGKKYLKGYTFDKGFFVAKKTTHFITFGVSAGHGEYAMRASDGAITKKGFLESYAKSQKPGANFRIIDNHHRIGDDIFRAQMPYFTDKKKKSALQAVFEAKAKDVSPFSNGIVYRFCAALPWQKISPEEKVNQILVSYAVEIKQARTQNEKLTAIARCCQDLEQTHPFADGNARTFGMLWVNRLLLNEGLEPVMMENPNRFDGYAVSELVDEIKNGQALFQSFKVSGATKAAESHMVKN